MTHEARIAELQGKLDARTKMAPNNEQIAAAGFAKNVAAIRAELARLTAAETRLKLAAEADTSSESTDV